MLRLIVTHPLTGSTVIDTIAQEGVVKAVAQKYEEMPEYVVRITYP